MKEINLILENIICQEILRRGYNVTVGRYGNKEVDFVCRKQNEKNIFMLHICLLL